MTMRITIEAVNIGSVQPLGYMQLPSYLVRFISASIQGEARFVPSSDDVRSNIGQVLDVEISQEGVSAFKSVGNSSFTQAIVALAEAKAFQVQGVVASVIVLSEPPGTLLVTVSACGAIFMLSNSDLEGLSPSAGEAVSFVAHELSLWDEAI